MKKTFERNEGKHARCIDTGSVNPLTKSEKKAIRRKTRFLLVESIRILVISLFLFAVQSWGEVFFPFVIALAVTVLLSVLEYEADDLE